MFKLTLLFLWPRFYAQTSSLSSPFVKYLYKYVLRFCSLVAMLPRRRRTGRKAGSVSCFRFQNECNKVEIALRVVQFWSEIKLVITNRTSASWSCDFVITRLISDQIALHSVQLPLLIRRVIHADWSFCLYIPNSVQLRPLTLAILRITYPPTRPLP